MLPREVALDLWVHWGKRANAELLAYDLDVEHADAYKAIEGAVRKYGFDVTEDREGVSCLSGVL